MFGRSKSIYSIVLISLIVLLAILHLCIVLLNHYYFKTYAFDYGVYNFAFYDYAHGHSSACPVYLYSEPVTFLQDHFSLTLIFLSPLYWIFSPLFGTYSLLIIQWLCIVFGAWATYKIILLKSKSENLGALSVIYYLLLYGRFSSYQSDCNLVIIGSAFLPVFIYFFEIENWWASGISFLFLIFNREDFALTLFFIGMLFILLYFKAKRKRFAAIIFTLSSILLFSIIFNWIIPSLEDEHKKFSLFNYDALGSNPTQAILFMINHPFETLKLFFVNHSNDVNHNGIKLIFYAVYFISGGFVLMIRPVYFVAFLPLIAKKMLNDDSYRWGHEGYNGIEVATLLPVFVFSALSEFKSKLTKITTIALIFGGTLLITGYFMTHMSHLYYGFNKFNPLNVSLYTSDYNTDKLDDMLKKIPDDAAVSASGRIVSHLAFRQKIYYFPFIRDAEYICVSTLGSTYPISSEEFVKRCDSLKVNPNWNVLLEDDGYLLLSRKK